VEALAFPLPATIVRRPLEDPARRPTTRARHPRHAAKVPL